MLSIPKAEGENNYDRSGNLYERGLKTSEKSKENRGSANWLCDCIPRGHYSVHTSQGPM